MAKKAVINGQRMVEIKIEHPLWKNGDFRRIAEFSGITPESSKEDFANFCGCLREASRHGCSSGVLGSFIYTAANVRFFDHYRDRIAYVLFEENCDSLESICQRRGLSDTDIVCQSDEFKEALTWAYIEAVGFSLEEDEE